MRLLILLLLASFTALGQTQINGARLKDGSVSPEKLTSEVGRPVNAGALTAPYELTFDEVQKSYTLSVTSDIALTVAGSGNIANSRIYITAQGDGSHTLTYPSDWKLKGTGAFNPTTTNEIEINYRGSYTTIEIITLDPVIIPVLNNAVMAEGTDDLTLTFDFPVTITTAGWTVTASGGAATVSSVVSGSGTTTIVFDLSRNITSGEEMSISYNPATGNTLSSTGNEIAAITNFFVDTGDESLPSNVITVGPGQDYATCQECAAVATNGQICQIKGGTYRETITPANNGVTFQPFPGETVIIDGRNLVGTSWTAHSGNIYKTTITLPINNSLTISITRGTSQSFITLAGNTNIITPNRMMDVWVQVDKSQDQENQVQVFINGFRFVVSNRIDSSTMVTTPTYAMEIGAGGNAVGRAVMTLKEITFQNALNTDAFRQTFITARMFKYGVVSFPNMIDGIPISSDWVLTNTLDENRYYLTNHLCQKPSDANVIVSIFSDGVNHVPSDGKVISRRISTDKGLTWSSKSQVYDPGGTDSIQDPGAGYGDDGRLHVIAEVLTTAAGPSWTTNRMMYMYSDDDGATWSTPVDISSSVASDGLAAYRVYGTVIENDGVLMCAYYKATSDTDFTNIARYVLRSTDNGANWASILIQTGTTNRNETDLVALDDDTILAVSRNESTLEFYQSMSTDNGATWTNQGDLSFGETFARATPVRLKKFLISSTEVIACYYSDRDRDIFKVIYGKVSDLISSGLTGWNEGTKFTLHQGSNNEHLHYGDVCHPDGDFKAIGQYAIDSFPNVGSGTENEMYTLQIPTFQYPFIKSAFGL